MIGTRSGQLSGYLLGEPLRKSDDNLCRRDNDEVLPSERECPTSH